MSRQPVRAVVAAVAACLAVPALSETPARQDRPGARPIHLRQPYVAEAEKK